MMYVIKFGTQYLAANGELSDRQCNGLRVGQEVADAINAARRAVLGEVSAPATYLLRAVRLTPKSGGPSDDR